MGWNGSNSGSGSVGSGTVGSARPSAVSLRSAVRADRKVGASVPLARKPAPRLAKGILAGLIVIIGAGLAAFIIGRGARPARPQSATKPATKQIAEVTPQIVTQKVEEVAKPEPPKETPQQKAKRERVAKLKSMTKEQRMEYIFREYEKKPINLQPASNRVYATGLEQAMDWIFTTEVGDLPPILPNIPAYEEAHLLEILAHKNEINENDSERAKQGKETVMLAKEEFVNFLTEGGDPQDFLPYYHDKLREAHMQYEETRKSVMQVAKEEPELLPEYLDSVNKSLEDKGIKPVTIPRPLAKHLGLQLDDRYLRGVEVEN